MAYILLLFAAVFILYTLVGYALLLRVVPWRHAPAPSKNPNYRPTVSVILAVHNGGRFLRAKLQSLLALHYPRERVEILVVSDRSTDETEAIAREFAADGVKLMRSPSAGKAAALNAAMPLASGEILFLTDVRQPIEQDALGHLISNFADPTIGAVTGEMRLLPPEQGEQADMDLYWRYEVWARKQHSTIDSIFNATGCIYAIRRSLAAPIPEDTLIDDAILPLRAFLRGFRVILEPAAIAYDLPAVSGAEFRRRMRTLAGLWQLHVRMPQLFTSSNRMRFHFLSHKFFRLMLPWALLVAFGSTLALPSFTWRTILLSGELGFGTLALIHPVLPAWFPLKRIGSVANTFLLMNAAALCSLIVFLVPAQRLWSPTRVTVKTCDSASSHLD